MNIAFPILGSKNQNTSRVSRMNRFDYKESFHDGDVSLRITRNGKDYIVSLFDGDKTNTFRSKTSYKLICSKYQIRIRLACNPSMEVKLSGWIKGFPRAEKRLFDIAKNFIG